MTPQVFDITSSSNVFDLAVFILPNLVTDPSFMSISLIVLELWKFSLIKDWSEIWKSKIPPSKFCPLSGDWGRLGISNLAQMSLILNAAKRQRSTFYCVWIIKGNPTAVTVEVKLLWSKFILIKLGLRYIISASLLSKWIGMTYFGGYLFVYVAFHLLFLKHLLLWYQAIFFGNCHILTFEHNVMIILVLFSSSLQVTCGTRYYDI